MLMVLITPHCWVTANAQHMVIQHMAEWIMQWAFSCGLRGEIITPQSHSLQFSLRVPSQCSFVPCTPAREGHPSVPSRRVPPYSPGYPSPWALFCKIPGKRSSSSLPKLPGHRQQWPQYMVFLALSREFSRKFPCLSDASSGSWQRDWVLVRSISVTDNWWRSLSGTRWAFGSWDLFALDSCLRVFHSELLLLLSTYYGLCVCVGGVCGVGGVQIPSGVLGNI